MHILIVDDEFSVRENLVKILTNFCQGVTEVFTASNIDEAQNQISSQKLDLVFLDVEMPGGSGFELLERLNKPNFHVVFTTAYAAYAIKAIKYAAIDFILKPINISEVQDSVEKARKKAPSGKLPKQIDVLKANRRNHEFDFKKISLLTEDGLEFFEMSTIVRYESTKGKSLFVFEGGRTISIDAPISEYEDLLLQSTFIKVHQQHIVNKQHVKKFLKGGSGTLVMSDESLIVITERKRKETLQALRLAQ